MINHVFTLKVHQKTAIRRPAAAVTDRRPRAMRWLLPMSCSSAVPLTGVQQARLKLVAYH